MDILTQVLLCLVVVLSLALFFRSGSNANRSDAPPPSSPLAAKKTPTASAAAGKTKAKSNKKKNKKAAAAGKNDQVTVPSSTLDAQTAQVQPRAVVESQPDEIVAQSAASSQRGAPAPSDSGLSASASDINAPFVPNGSVTYADYEVDDEDDESQVSQDDIWQNVAGKGAARAVKGNGSNLAAPSQTSSYASANPFAVLPSSDASTKTRASQGRVLSVPSSQGSTSKGVSSSTSKSARNGNGNGNAHTNGGASAGELTKRQRQNAARAAANKAAKEAEEAARIAKLNAHRREAQRAAAAEQDRKRAPKPFSVNVAGNGAGARANGSGSVGTARGGLDSRASVNLDGQLVWE